MSNEQLRRIMRNRLQMNEIRMKILTNQQQPQPQINLTLSQTTVRQPEVLTTAHEHTNLLPLGMSIKKVN